MAVAGSLVFAAPLPPVLVFTRIMAMLAALAPAAGSSLVADRKERAGERKGGQQAQGAASVAGGTYADAMIEPVCVQMSIPGPCAVCRASIVRMGR
jgi:hypothetical protein